MKYLKNTGIYFLIMVIGYNILNIANANDLWYLLLITGNCMYYFAKLFEKDS